MTRRKLTEKVQQVIVDALRNGLPLREAAALAGIDDGTLKQWIAVGREKTRVGSTRHETALFVVAVDQAMAQCQRALLARTILASGLHYETAAHPETGEKEHRLVEGKPELALKLLLARFPDVYAQRHEVTGPGGADLLSPDASRAAVLEAAARLLKNWRGRTGRSQAYFPPGAEPVVAGSNGDGRDDGGANG